MSVGAVLIEAREMAQRQRRNRAALAWVRVHLAVLCQFVGALMVVAGLAVIVGALAGVVFGAATASVLVGIVVAAWGVLREAGRV